MITTQIYPFFAVPLLGKFTHFWYGKFWVIFQEEGVMLLKQQQILDARIDKSDVPHIYKKVASVYDIWARLTESKARNRCLELASIRDGESVLEVAVGTGERLSWRSWD